MAKCRYYYISRAAQISWPTVVQR